MIKFGKVSTVMSAIVALLFLVFATVHRLQLDLDDPAGYRESPFLALLILTLFGMLAMLLVQTIATIGLVVKRADAGRWPLYAGLVLGLLVVASFAGCMIDSPTLLYAT